MNRKILLKTLLTILILVSILTIGTKVFATDVTNTTTKSTTTTQKKSIADLKVWADTKTKEYTGNRIQCIVAICDGDIRLKKGKDYKVTYTNDILPGKVSVLIEGIGDYTGSVKKYYYIAPAKGKVTSVSMNSDYSVATIKWQKR